MRDILEIRRHLVLTENAFPEQLQTAYRGMERTANPWSIAPEKRLEWAAGLRRADDRQNPASGPAVVGRVRAGHRCPRRRRRPGPSPACSRLPGSSYAVLGTEERCTGDSARRSGNEYLFHELATANVETLNRAAPKRIVTTCPHCLHTLKNEYPAFGGNYTVIHHTQLFDELIRRRSVGHERPAGAARRDLP